MANGIAGAALLLVLLASSGAEAADSVVAEPLSIAAFNVQHFGRTKMSKPEVVDVLIRIMSQYDITLVQEISDITEVAINNLTNLIRLDSGKPYELQLSPRSGDEQYGYIYRSDRVSVVKQQLYPSDTDKGDQFAREPYMVTFETSQVRYLSAFTLIGVHTRPTSAAAEISALSDVIDYASQQAGAAQDIVVLGDFNAGCSYVTNSQWETNALKNREDVVWGIADYTDTTVSSTNCAYDRVVMKGESLAQALVAGSIGPFRYDETWNYTEELTKLVSDHYPVHMKLMPKTVSTVEKNVKPQEAFTVQDKRRVSESDVTAALSASNSAGYVMTGLYSTSGQLVKAEAVYGSYKLSGEGILDTLKDFKSAFPSLVTDDVIKTLAYKIENGALDDPTVYEPASRPRWYAEVSCSDLQVTSATLACDVTVKRATKVA